MSSDVRKWVLFGLLALVVAGGLVVGWQWWTTGRFIESTDNAYVQADITVIAPKVAGYVSQVVVADNQAVQKGDVLLVIDDADYRAKVASAQAELERTKAAAATVGVDAQRQQAAIAEAASRVQSANADLDLARKELSRYGKLQKEQFASVQRFDQANAEAQRDLAHVSEARAAAMSAQRQLQVLNARQREAVAMISAASAGLQTAQNDLANTVVRAPGSGVVGNRSVRTGQYVRPGLQVMAIVPLQDVYITANFKETQVGEMQKGQSATVKVDAYPDVKLNGVVDSFSPASGALFSLLPPENATGNFTKIVQRVPVKVRLTGPAPAKMRLTPGMSVITSIDTRTTK